MPARSGASWTTSPASPRDQLERLVEPRRAAVIGVAMRNEKRAADSRSSPANSPAEIEIPDRLIPGTSASAWAPPIAERLRERQVDREQSARSLALGEPQDAAADDEHQGDEADLPEALLDEVVEQHADDERRESSPRR